MAGGETNNQPSVLIERILAFVKTGLAGHQLTNERHA